MTHDAQFKDMSSSWTIRKALRSDSAGLQECMSKAYAVYEARMGGQLLPPMDLDYADEIDNYPTWVIDKNGFIAGGLTMVLNSEYASIANVAVHPDCQGNGLGKRLLNFAEKMAIENKHSEMRLATHVLLTENIALYRHLGWREHGRDDLRVYMKKMISDE